MAQPKLDHASVFAVIQEHLHSPSPVAERMAAVISICERSVPHPDWATLRKLPYNRLAPMRAWLRRPFEEEPPPMPLAGLWLGLHNPRRSGETTADIRLGGSTRFTDDGELEWAFGLEYRPKAASACISILRSINSVAYVEGIGRQGNNAEWSLCLAYAAFAAQRLFSEIEPSVVLRGSDSVGGSRVRRRRFSASGSFAAGWVRFHQWQPRRLTRCRSSHRPHYVIPRYATFRAALRRTLLHC